MATGWFLTKMVQVATNRPRPTVICPLWTYKAQAKAEGGNLGWAEALDGHTLAKVVASQATIDEITALPGVVRVLEKIDLSDTMADLTTVQRNFVQNKLLEMGYSQAEIDSAMGANLAEWRTRTYGDLLSLIVSRRRRIRYDAGNFYWDGADQPQPPNYIEWLDNRVR